MIYESFTGACQNWNICGSHQGAQTKQIWQSAGCSDQNFHDISKLRQDCWAWLVTPDSSPNLLLLSFLLAQPIQQLGDWQVLTDSQWHVPMGWASRTAQLTGQLCERGAKRYPPIIDIDPRKQCQATTVYQRGKLSFQNVVHYGCHQYFAQA